MLLSSRASPSTVDMPEWGSGKHGKQSRPSTHKGRKRPAGEGRAARVLACNEPDKVKVAASTATEFTERACTWWAVAVQGVAFPTSANIWQQREEDAVRYREHLQTAGYRERGSAARRQAHGSSGFRSRVQCGLVQITMRSNDWHAAICLANARRARAQRAATRGLKAFRRLCF